MRRPGRLALGTTIAVVLAGCAGGTGQSAPGVATPVESTPGAASAPAIQPAEPSASANASASTPEEWRQVASFGEPGGIDMAAGVAHGNAGFLAVGRRFEPGHVGYNVSTPYLWASADGESWEELPMPIDVQTGQAVSVLATPDGDYVLIGATFDAATGSHPFVLRSPDGRTWEPVESGLSDGMFVGKAVRGELGYLLIEPQGMGTDPGLWLSQDGLEWEEVLPFDQSANWVQVSDIAAGPEGFVAMGVRIQLDSSSWQRFTVASGDGRNWVDSPEPFGVEPHDYQPTAHVSSMGPDWIATVSDLDDSARFWTSADGLNWEAASTLPAVGARLAWAPVLEEADGQLFFSANGGGIGPPSPGLWTSDGGGSWRPLEVNGSVALGAVAAEADALVIVGAHEVDGEWRAAMWHRGRAD